MGKYSHKFEWLQLLALASVVYLGNISSKLGEKALMLFFFLLSVIIVIVICIDDMLGWKRVIATIKVWRRTKKKF